MAGTKEIRNQIESVKSTQKITKAMQMVATSKMRRAQDRMKLARPYAEKIRNVIGNLAHANPDYRHPFMATREAKNVGFIVVSTDRGLAGGLNANLFRTTLNQVREWQRIDRLFVVYSEFVNTMTQRPQVRQLLPVEPADKSTLQEHWDYIYEPSAAEILDGLLMRYIESQVYRAAVENVASEMAARMVAMKAATDNAGKLIHELQLVYNKARQAAITTELAEIVGGAAAV